MEVPDTNTLFSSDEVPEALDPETVPVALEDTSTMSRKKPPPQLKARMTFTWQLCTVVFNVNVLSPLCR